MDAAHCYLEGNADAVDFCPHETYANLLAASTYNLQEGDCPSRSGSVYLFNVGDGEDLGLNLLQKLDTAGVFDIRWSGGGLELAQADADGCLRIYKLDDTEEKGTGFDLMDVELVVENWALGLQSWNLFPHE